MKKKILDIQNVSLAIATVDKPILSEINYQIYQSDFVIILGSNGSGKSSLLKLIDRRYQATTGQILLEEKLLSSYSENKFCKRVKTLTQNLHDSLFASLTVFENYLLIKNKIGSQKKEREFFKNYLLPFNPNLALKLDQQVDKLSGGEKQALALALTVLNPPDILLLDEHTSALDPKSAKDLMSLTQKIVQEFQITCVMTTHDLEIAEQYGNRLVALQHGKIYQQIESREKVKLNQDSLLAVCY